MSASDINFIWDILPPEVKEKAIENLCVIRYVTAGMYVTLLLEYVYSIPQEVEYIWKAPLNVIQVLFLIFRYSTLGGVTLMMQAVAGFSGLLTDHFCKHTISALAALAVLAMGIADVIVLVRVSVLWGRQRLILGFLFSTFLITYGIAIGCAAMGALRLVESTLYIPELKTCAPTEKPYSIIGVWAPGALFDVLVLSLTTWNAFSKPRTQNTPMVRTLHRDGIAYFLVIAGLRTFNLFMTIFSPSFLIAICVSWPLTAITLSRFLFHVRDAESKESKSELSSRTTDCELQIAMEERRPSTGKYHLEPLRPSDEIVEQRGSPTSTRLQMWEVLETRSAQSHNPTRSLSPTTWIETHSIGSTSRCSSISKKI